MPLRLIEIVLPDKYRGNLEESLKEHETIDIWQESIEAGRIHFEILVPTEHSEEILDFLEKRFSHVEGFRIILLPVHASIPRPGLRKEKESEEELLDDTKKPISKIIRVSREELYANIENTVRLSWIYAVMIFFSALVASIGLLRNNAVFIIGAMVIAPMLGPNLALSFATTLSDANLIRKAFKAIVIGTLTAVVPAVIIGIVFEVDTGIPELIYRTEVSFGDVVVALIAGSAAVLSLTSGQFRALIGVMVAVALLPPLVTFGMLAGAGNWELALGSLLLFLVNLICVNLAGVLTFLFQGIRPLTWWEAKKARKASQRAILIWATLLAALVLLLIFS